MSLKWSEKETIEKLSPLGEDVFTVKGVHEVNPSQGHPYTIGPRHVGYASDNFGGMLSENAIEALEKSQGPSCAHPHCRVSYKDHKADRVIFLQLKRNVANKEAGKILYAMKMLLQENNQEIAGFTFVDTPEKYRMEE